MPSQRSGAGEDRALRFPEVLRGLCSPAVKRINAGPAMAVLWGEVKKGPVGFLLKFPAGAVVPLHVHSSDYQGVVISGEFSHAAGKEPVVALGPGSDWAQRSRLPHLNACSAAGPCIVYLTAPRGFDLTFVK